VKSYNGRLSQSHNQNKTAGGAVLVYLFMQILERSVQSENALFFPESPAEATKMVNDAHAVSEYTSH